MSEVLMEIWGLRDHYLERADDVRTTVIRLAHDAEFTDEELVHLYFETDFPAAAIAEYLGCRQSIIGQKLPAYIYEHHCPRCEKTATFTVTSRSHLLKINNKRETSTRCDACEEIVANEPDSSVKYAILAQQRAIRIKQLRSLPYNEYLQSDHWDEVRRAAVRRARYRCQLCNADKPLHVHHRTYRRLGEELATDVIALCKDCHAKHHGKEDC